MGPTTEPERGTPQSAPRSERKPESLEQAVRSLIRDELGRPPEPAASAPTLSWQQAAVLLLIAVDLAFLSTIADPLRNLLDPRIMSVMERAVPLLFGSALVLYVNRLRDWVLAWSARRSVGVVAGGVFVLLVLPQLPLYSIPITLEPTHLRVQLDGKGNVIDRRSSPFRLAIPSLGRHEVVVKDSVGSREYSETFAVGGWQALRGTFTSAPSSAFPLTVRYRVRLDWGNGAADVVIDGSPPLWVERTGFDSTRPADGRVTYFLTIGKDSTAMAQDVMLPPGPYTFTLRQGRCVVSDSTRQVRPQQVTIVPLDSLARRRRGCPTA